MPKILHNIEGRLRISHDRLFGNPNSLSCQKFIEKVFTIEGIETVKVNPLTGTCLVHYNPDATGENHFSDRILEKAREKRRGKKGLSLFPSSPDERNIEFRRIGSLISEWQVASNLPGRLRLKHPELYRKPSSCQHIEKTLFNTPGVGLFNLNPTTCSVLIFYDETKLDKGKLIRIVDAALKESFHKPQRKNKPSLNLSISTGCLGLAALGPCLPALIPFNAALIFYNAHPSYKDAVDGVVKEKKLNVDALDTVITLACLATGQIFAAALMVWCLSFGKNILDKTHKQSKELLTRVLGKEARFAWLFKDGREIEVSVESLKKEDIIVVSTGEAVPIDGEVSNGEAAVDQHILTGESAPVEKGTGDKVFASTMVLAGKIYVKVKKSGEETAAAKIKKMIIRSANYKVKIQSTGERIADKAVLPTVGVAGLGYLTGGQSAALAIINCDYGTGIRIAAPMGLLSYLTYAAREGILVKEGIALETLQEVDTFIFDKTGTLTQEAPEVKEIIAGNGSFNEEKILAYAACAEQKFSHPIARAILDKAKELDIKLPEMDKSKYHVGFGIELGIDGDMVKLGSTRFMERENVKIPSYFRTRTEEIRNRGGSNIVLAVNNKLAGLIDLEASARLEAYDVIQALRQRNIKNIVLISGDHEGPTRNLAKKIGIDEYYSEVLPHEKANHIKRIQRKGHKSAMVGDGINDSIALGRVDVSISLRGASSVATDTANIVFMDGALKKIPLLLDISRDLQKNVRRSFLIIAIPNTICILGAMTGVFGLAHSIVCNNGTNFLATLNGTLPMAKLENVVDQPPVEK